MVNNKWKKFLPKLIIILLSAVLIFPQTVLSLDETEEYSVLKTQLNVECDKVWTINFNAPLDFNSLLDKIKVVDSEENLIPIQLELKKDNKSLNIIPINKYKSNTVYTLFINKDIKSSSGDSVISNSLKMDFLVSRKLSEFPNVGSYDNLVSLLKENENINWDNNASLMEIKNNTQSDIIDNNVNGDIEEADVVKTDGEYIYKINRGNIEVVKAYPANNLEVVNLVQFDNSSFSPTKLYVKGHKLVVLGEFLRVPDKKEVKVSTSSAIEVNEGSVTLSSLTNPKNPRRAFSPMNSKKVMKLMVYDIKDIRNIKLLKEVEVDGQYITSRRIGNKIYTVSNEYINYFALEKGSSITPKYKDSSISNDYLNMDYKDIHYVPNFQEPNFIVISCIDLDRTFEPVNLFTCLGAGQNVYVSQNHLYVAVNKKNYSPYWPINKEAINENTYDESKYEENTDIYKFSLEEDKIHYEALGKIPGKIINGASMDEYEGRLRVGTTKVDLSEEDKSNASSNNIYILDDNLDIIGYTEELARGNNIKTMRFMENRAYLVTFKDKDPIFAVNIADPNNTEIIGYLKLPGFNYYIQPYDENHLIGIGYDTKEVYKNNESGDLVNVGEIDTGMKISLYNIEDINNIWEQFSTKIGDRGTYTEVLNNSKSLFLSKEKSILVLPVTVMKVKENEEQSSEYGEFAFQGAYVYNIDMEKGIEFKGKITHLNDEELSSEAYQENYDKSIQRILNVNDNLYTISNSAIAVNDLTTLEEKGYIEIEKYLDRNEYIKFINGSMEINVSNINNLSNGIEAIIEQSDDVKDSFKWEVSIEDPEVLAFVTDRSFNMNYSRINQNIWTRVWKFKALKPGETKLVLKLLDENSGDIEKTIEYDVVIN